MVVVGYAVVKIARTIKRQQAFRVDRFHEEVEDFLYQRELKERQSGSTANERK